MSNNLKCSLAIIITALMASCTTSEKKQDRDEQLCFLQITQGEMVFTESDNVEFLTDSLVMNLTIKNDSVTGILNWIPAQKDKMLGTLAGTIQGDDITAIFTYHAEGITTKEEKVLKLDATKVLIKTGRLELRNGIWVLKDKSASFSQSIPRTTCQ